jgi:hypothetical protein
VLFAPLQAQDSGTATAYVYRQNHSAGAGREPSVYVDDRKVADMENGRYFALKLQPGSHVLQSDDRPNKPDAKITQQWAAGTVYYFQISIVSGFKPYGKIVQVSEEHARADLAKLKPSEAKSVEPAARDMVSLTAFK